MPGPGFVAVMSEIEARLAGPGVDEVLFNGFAHGFLVRQGLAEAFASPFASDVDLVDWLQELAEREGVRLDPLLGAAGGSLDDGRIRWHAVLPPLSRDGPLASFRRHRFDAVTVDDFAVGCGDATATRSRLRQAVSSRRPLLIAGPTGAGKTTLLAALLAEVASERMILIEATPELPRLGPSTVRLAERPPDLDGVGAVGLSRLVREALRLRPDRLVLGEIRGPEALAFLEMSATGHGGIMATLHAGSAEEARDRLVLLAGPHLRGDARAAAARLDVVVLGPASPPRILAFDQV